MTITTPLGDEYTFESSPRTEFICEFGSDGSLLSFEELNLTFNTGFVLDNEDNRYFYGFF